MRKIILIPVVLISFLLLSSIVSAQLTPLDIISNFINSILSLLMGSTAEVQEKVIPSSGTIVYSTDCDSQCIDQGFASGECKSGDCQSDETSIGQDGCPSGQICCCSGKLVTEWSFKYIQVDNNMPPRIDFSSGPAYFFGLDMGDLTGDGYKDIVAHKMFYRNPGGNMEGAWQRIAFPWDWTDAFAIVDVDDDQYGDVIAEGEEVSNNVNIYWLEAQNTAGTSWNRVLIGSIPKTSHLWSQGYEIAQIVPGGKPEILIAGGDGVYYFTIPPNPASGNWPRVKITDNGFGYATGDINRDGYLDVAGRSDSVNVAWWKNPGDGSGYWSRYTIGQTIHKADRFAIADIDRDGRNDIIVSEELYPVQPSASLFWFKANTDPQTSGWVRNTVVSDTCSLNSMSVADMDSDGDMDIVTGEMGNPSCLLQKRIMIFENDGSGNFKNIVVDTGKESHLGARVSDLDGDGDLDIISIGWNEYQYVHAWRNDRGITPPPQFTHVIVDSTTTPSYAFVRTVGDVDGDGFSDIIGAISSHTGLVWYKYPSWNKYTIKLFNWRVDDIGNADLDNDGDLDVVGIQDNDGKVYWFENPRPSGNPTSEWTSHYIGINNGNVKDLEIADFNNDGKLDVVTRTPTFTSIFIQNSLTSWTKVKTVYHSFVNWNTNTGNIDGLDVGDLDTDGDLDIVLNGFWIETPSDLVGGAWTQYNIDSKWWNQDTDSWRDNNAKVRVVDINKDGRLDILIDQSEIDGYPVSWYEAINPKSGPWTEHIIDYFDYGHTLQAGDMDNDGDVDVVVGKFERDVPPLIPSPFPLKVYYNKGGNGLSWDVQEVDNVGIYTGVIGDIGNDGDLDIVGSRSYWKGPVEMWENNLH